MDEFIIRSMLSQLFLILNSKLFMRVCFSYKQDENHTFSLLIYDLCNYGCNDC